MLSSLVLTSLSLGRFTAANAANICKHYNTSAHTHIYRQVDVKCTIYSLLVFTRFVSRQSPKDSRNHTVLGVMQFKPAEFAQQMNLNMENAWGILRCILDFIKKLDDGKYLIMKDPNKVTH